MTPGERYRTKAAEFEARAKGEASEKVRRELESLAKAYRRLAMQADENQGLDISFEFPPKTPKPDDEPIA